MAFCEPFSKLESQSDHISTTDTRRNNRDGVTTKSRKLFALQQKQLKTIRKCHENIKSWLGLDVNGGPVPLRIMDDFDYAEDKVLIFSTCWMIPLKKIGAAVERKLQPFLPDRCDHRGLFLCAGQAPENMIGNLETQFKTHPDNVEIKSIFGNCVRSSVSSSGGKIGRRISR